MDRLAAARRAAHSRSAFLALQQHSVQVCFVPDIFSFKLLHHSMTEIAGLPVINLTDSPLEGANLMAKASRTTCFACSSSS